MGYDALLHITLSEPGEIDIGNLQHHWHMASYEEISLVELGDHRTKVHVYEKSKVSNLTQRPDVDHHNTRDILNISGRFYM